MKIMSVYKNPAPKNIIKATRNNALSRCKSADEIIVELNIELRIHRKKII